MTHDPDPATVRPEHILKQALEWVLGRYKEEQDYGWAGSQLRSIRQDLTIQNIKNGLTLRAYEQNAMIALREGDY